MLVQDIESVLREVGQSVMAQSVSRQGENFLIVDYTGQTRIKHKSVGAALKKRGLKCNHVRTNDFYNRPAILVFTSKQK